MEENHPCRYSVNRNAQADISPTMAAIELGDTRGYSKYGDRLKLLAEYIAPAIEPGETTYQDPPKPEYNPHG